MCKGIETDTLFAYKILWLVSGHIPFILPFIRMGYDYLFLSYAMILKADDMCQNEVF